MIFFSERKKIEDRYKAWLEDNKGVKDCSFNLITFLDYADLFNEDKVDKFLGADRDSNPNVLEKVESFLKEYFNYEVQAFTTRNVVGDPMETIYNEDGIQIDYCEGYDYIEIFGLPLEDFYKLREKGLIRWVKTSYINTRTY